MALLGTCVLFSYVLFISTFSHETRYIIIHFELSVSQRILTLLFYFKWKAATKYPKSTKDLSTLNSFRLNI